MPKPLHIITPVKDSYETAAGSIRAIKESDLPPSCSYTIYNDFSTASNKKLLEELTLELGFDLVHLEDLTTNPSPNYRLVLQLAQKKALEAGADLMIIESDVYIKQDTIKKMQAACTELDNPGMVAAVTVDESGVVNFPYLYASSYPSSIIKTRKRLSFCCSILSNSLLSAYDFKFLDPDKSWFDVFISHKSRKLGFNNYLITKLPVLHRPHSSRPWKQLKYSRPWKYYFLKILKQRDKI
ncbi:MAG: glycosyltransferase family 2 protein [Bacteroidales bacterium]|jgi:hypothetical protein|nr:glycosyltransferase family 2 protein [Bacteroidota bacterium]HOF93659.1 glycosyltransferase family 2 protein [Bacteroidales bacterium]